MKELPTVIRVLLSVLTVSSCTITTSPKIHITPSMTPHVQKLYGEAVAAFQNKDFQGAREKYQAVLEEARLRADEAGVGFGLAGLGATYQALHEYSPALDSLREALPYFVRTNNQGAEGWAYAAIGEIHLQMDDPQKAIRAFKQALSVGETLIGEATEEEKLAILSVRGEVFRQRAMAHERLQEFDEAVKYLRMAANDLETAGKREGAAAVLWNAAEIARQELKQPESAIGLYDKSSRLFETEGKSDEVLWTQLGAGWSYLEASDFHKAISIFSGVVNVAQKRGLSEILWQGYLGLGQAFEKGGQFRQALTQYQAWLDQQRSFSPTPDNVLEAEMLASMGRIYRLLSQYQEAIEHFHLAAVRFRETNHPREEAIAWKDVAEIFAWLGDFRQASHYYRRTLAFYKSQGNQMKQIEILAALAEAIGRSDEGTAEEMNQYLLAAANLQKSLADTVGVDLQALWEKRSELMTGNPEEQDLQYARDYQKAKNRPGEHFETALLHWQVRKSKEFFKIWEASVPALGAEYLLAVGTLYQKWGILQLLSDDPKNASSALSTAQRYFTSLPFNREVAIEWAKTWYYLGEAYRQVQDFDLAFSYFESALLVAEYLRTPEIHWIYAGAARNFVDLGEHENALAAYRNGLEILESVQSQQGIEEVKIGILAGSAYVYRQFISLLLELYRKSGEQSYLAEAFHNTQRGKARAFLEIFGKTRVPPLSTHAGSLAKEEEEIHNEIARIHHLLRNPTILEEEENRLLNRLEKLRQERRTFEQKSIEESSKNSQIVFSRPVTVGEVQAVLTVESVLFEYIATTEGVTLWAITKDQVHTYDLPGQIGVALLEEYLKTLRMPLIGSDELKKHIALGKELYQWVIKPAEKHLRGKQQLIVAADGPLYYLPFEALIVSGSEDDAKGHTTLADVPYLIKHFQVSYIPSASVLVAQHREQRKQNQTVQLPLLAFGDPIYQQGGLAESPDVEPGRIRDFALRGMDFDRLEFSGEEVLRIARVWDLPPTSEHINLQDRASVERVQNLNLSRYRILHFATHAVLGDKVGFLSQPALVLSQTGGSDRDSGLLQFSDILSLKLDADLVVLSACETGLGQLRDGEGIVGLTRAFFYAGASSAVVSLWKVQDQSTALLMEEFYRQLKSGRDKAEALRLAKLAIMKTKVELKATGMQQSLAAPFFWAPFILAGDSGPIRE